MTDSTGRTRRFSAELDAYDHPELYLHKEVEFVAQAFRPKGMEENMFVPVRKIMTCPSPAISSALHGTDPVPGKIMMTQINKLIHNARNLPDLLLIFPPNFIRIRGRRI